MISPRYSVGIDLVQISRFKHTCKTGGEAFLQLTFTKDERSSHRTIEGLAGVFAAKEAFMKAFGAREYSMASLQVEKDSWGKPRLRVLSLGLEHTSISQTIEISISHDGDYATAVCIIEHQ